MDPTEQRFYEIAATEIAEKRPVLGLMSKASSDADGDEKKAAARYIRMRVEQLLAQHADTLRRTKQAEPMASTQRACCWCCVSFEKLAG